MNTIRVRFAPSPTGDLHIGGLRTALFDYLLAKKHGGRFVLRIEDTDQKRLNEESVSIIIDALAWCGISYDEGPHKEGLHGPYVQSERLSIYRKYVDELLAKDAAYPCFCSAERLEAVRQQQAAAKQPPRYDGTCRLLSESEASQRVKAGEQYVIRAKIPQEGSVEFEDLVRGRVSFEYALVDDQVLLKTDGFPTYHLAVVVDDHLMEITHVIRGEEWLSSTPKHLFLYHAFGWKVPALVHVPLILSPHGGKLSKRDGAVSVLAYRESGYLPEALINFIAFLGWNPKTEQEVFSLEELATAFSLEGIQKSGAIFDVQKLNHLNAQYIRMLAPQQLVERAGERVNFLKSEYGPYLAEALALAQDRLVTLNGIQEQLQFLVALPDYVGELLVPKKSNTQRTIEALTMLQSFLAESSDEQIRMQNIEEAIKQLVVDKEFSNSEALWPLRVSLSGQQHSPGVFEILRVLGKNKALERLEIALQKLQNLAKAE